MCTQVLEWTGQDGAHFTTAAVLNLLYRSVLKPACHLVLCLQLCAQLLEWTGQDDPRFTTTDQTVPKHAGDLL
jgi:hypothetical protein